MSSQHLGQFLPWAGTALFLLMVSPAAAAPARPASDVRAIDGVGNNVANPVWGAAETNLLRIGASLSSTGAYYPDSGSGATFRGGPGSATAAANPRDVSNAVATMFPVSPLNTHQMSGMVFQWGQFLDHDISLEDTSSSVSEMTMIATGPSDPLFPGIPFSRSLYAAGTGTSAANPRQQVNTITAYIDGSNVYGSDAARAAALRDVGGKLKTSAGNLMPFNTAGLPNAANPGQNQADLFLAGDKRSNEQVGLTAMHTLFVREHNRLVDALAANNPAWSGDELYETARKIVGAEMQAITYREFLPAVLGSAAPQASAYSYNSTLDAGIANEFATALYRFGHSLLPAELPLAAVGSHPSAEVPLRDAFFAVGFFAGDATGATDRVAQLLKGISHQTAMEVDAVIIDDVRNFLFGPPGAGGMDLVSLNIERGRDHGLPMYNDARALYGLAPAATFADITSDVNLQSALASVYANPADVDLWVGALSEDHVPGAAFGELITTGLIEQFTRLRDGDRYFYAADAELMDNPAVSGVIDLAGISLSQIICLNTGMTDMPANVFLVPEPNALALALLALGWGVRRRR